MSSLPPYNPRLGDRALWLCAIAGTGGISDELPEEAPWGLAVVDAGGADAEVRRRYPGLDVRVLADPDEVSVPETSWLLAAGHPVWCEALLRRLMGMPPGTATFMIAPGAVSIIQLLPDRAVLVSLNNGRALD